MPDQSLLATTLQALVQEEYQRTYYATERLGKIVPLALRAVEILNTSIFSMPADSGIISALALSINKSITLDFLSYIRGHTAQGELNCRQAVEITSICAYLIANTEAEIIDITDVDNPKLIPARKMQDKAHKWIEVNEPVLSEELKRIKSSINDGFAHGGLYVAHLTIDAEAFGEDSKIFRGTFFDNLTVNETRAFLVSFCGLVVLIVETIRRANDKGGGLGMRDRLEAHLQDYDEAVENYRQALGREMGIDD